MNVGGGLPSALLYKAVDRNRDKQFAAYTKQPMVQKAIDYFRANIKSVDSVDALLKNYRLKSFVLQAFGLDELTNSTYLVKRILTDDLDDDAATANRMKDSRFREMAASLRLDQGMDSLQSDKVIDALVARYQIQGFEKQLGEQNIAVRSAMYFKRQAGQITSIYQVMADPTLRQVAVVATGLPQQITGLDFDKQVALFTKKVDVAQLKDAKYVDRLINQYLTRTDFEQNGAAGSPIAGLFAPASGLVSVNVFV